MNNISTVIIDDEAFNRDLVKSLIKELNPLFEIAGEASNLADAFRVINSVKPDVVFLDIKMPDGNGFELLKQFNKISFEVIFVSGFDEYALKAFEYNALDYLLKPISLSKFSDTLQKVQARVMNNLNYLGNLKNIVDAYDTTDAIITKIPIHYPDKVVLLPVNEIMYILAKDGCTCFFRSHEEKHISARQLSHFDFILENFPNFLKITKSEYININFVDSYSKGFDCRVTMKDGSVHEISRRKKNRILEMIHSNKKFK